MTSMFEKQRKEARLDGKNERRVTSAIFIITAKRVSTKVKVYWAVVRPAMMFGLETVPMIKKQKQKLQI